MSTTLIDLAEARGSEVGGKAGPLAELLRAGFDVPPGFVVPTPVFRQVVSGLERTATDAERRGRILEAELPPGLAAHLGAALDRLTEHCDSGCVAVRSSSSSEDTDRRSAAGQHHSVLGVRGLEAVTRAIRECWESTWSDRALAYGAAGVVGEMAVLVQEWVDPQVSGVMFTRPQGSGDVSVIEATWGIGDGLVSGRVTPDSWTVDGSGVVRRRVGGKARREDRLGGRIVWTSVSGRDRARPCLSDDDVLRLHDLGSRIAARLGGARDIEWVLDGDRIRVVQARPVTAEIPSRAPELREHNGGTLHNGTLHGIAGAVGTATGPVRHVRGPADFRRVRPGDVLICRETDPAWTPLFSVAAAVVTETGGVLSHAAIVAREVGIPAVLAVEGAMERLAPGVQVHVDGSAGSVTCED